MAASLSKELVLLILQFLEEEKYSASARRLEQESGFYFNLPRFEEMVMNGDWENVESYLLGFTKTDDNRYSMKMFFEIRKQKYLEALDRKDRDKAVEILMKDLKVFSQTNGDLFREMTQLLTLENFRENEQLSKYVDSKTARSQMVIEIKKLIETNPVFREKINFPTLTNSRLRTLINQSLNWQHQLCKTPQPNPDIKTLFSDHSCGSSQQNGGRAPSPVTNRLMGSVTRPLGFSPLTAHGPYQPAPGGLQASMAGWMLNPSQVPHPSAHAGPMGFNPQQSSTAALLKRPQTPTNNMAMDYHTADSEHVRKRSRPSFGFTDEVNNARMNAMPVAFTSHGHSSNHQFSADDLPTTVIMNLNQGSEVKSMDFHPVQRTLLLVGTISGEVMVWELGSRNRICHQRFGVWNLGACSAALQASLRSDYSASINRVMWSPDGSKFGVAYSKHILHVYNHQGEDLANHLEIEAHVGSVNDLAFSYPNKKHCIITCGEDKLIKVWDAVSGVRQYTFESHKTPVHSVCPHHRETIQFIFSTAIDGKIKAWLYDDEGPRLDYDAPGHAVTTMAYSADGKRLFSCGTSNDGDAYLVEWNESEGAVRHTYAGLGKRTAGIIQFDTMKNRILAAGNDYMIKFWDMDNVNVLAASDADGGLPPSPCIRFNKEGTLLAVSTNENAVKILGSADGVRLLRTIENRPYDGSRVVSSGTVVKSPPVAALNTAAMSSNTFDRVSPVAPMVAVNGEHRSLADMKPRIPDEPAEKSRIINDPSHCLSMRLTDCSKASKVSRLTYTNSGFGILALTTNAVLKLWKWNKDEQNPSGKATARIAPPLWQPTRGLAMTNDISTANLDDAVPCFALSKNDSYVMSASGGKISLFNMMTFKTMTSFMAPPPAATCLAFHPRDNNVVAIGMDDYSIQIYNVRSDEDSIILKGHQKRITGLAFSNILSVLVSSGSDSQLCVWSMDTWEKVLSKYIQLPAGRSVAPAADTHVQFHHNQKHLLVVHETQIAIFEAPSLNCLKQWKPLEASGPITHATYSCDSETIYVSHEDGIVAVLTASTLRLRCRIYSSSYISANPSARTYPMVIAAHPSDPNQIALGLSDGGVCVLEPLESDGKWGTLPLVENGGVRLQDHAV